MSGLEIFLGISIMVCAAGVIVLCFVYQSLESCFQMNLRFLTEIRRDLMELKFRQLGRAHGVQRIPKDTEVGE
jgi:hypothetical protein